MRSWEAFAPATWRAGGRSHQATGRHGDSTGSASLWALALMLVVCLAGAVALAGVQLGIARQRLASAADLAALAAAQSRWHDPEGSCALASEVARRNAAWLSGCVPSGDEVAVVVSGPAPPWVTRLASWTGRPVPVLSASARAGLPSPSGLAPDGSAAPS